MAPSALRTGYAVATLAASLALACGPSGQDRPAGVRESRDAVISDAVHNAGVPGFFFLPPMVPAAAYGEFRPGLAPQVIVERRDPSQLAPAQTVVTFTAAEIQTESDSHYKVNWDTRASTLDPAATYRIRVVLGWFDLGFADVDVVSSGSELRNVATGEFIPLLDGRTLPIKFRIEPAAMKCPERPEGPCQAQDQCHVAGTCDPLTGACSNPQKADGTACADGDACTQTDTCQAGACTGADPVICTASDQCHEAGTCDSTTGLCSDPARPDDTPCDDADLCTRSDTCQAGACTGEDPVVCTALDQCHDAGVCEPFTGLCPDPEKPDDAPCDDGNACTVTDTCQVGACVGADPVVCLASDACHEAGLCDTATGVCSNPPKADGSACTDGNACTRSDTCRAGACAGSDPVICTASDQCHDAGACDPLTGACSNPNRLDGSPCSDADFCTAGDACIAGACLGSSITCDDQDACTQNGCDPATAGADGVTGCVYVPDNGLPGCEVPPPPATVSIVGLSAVTEEFFANQRLNFSVKLLATADRADYDVEFLLFPIITDPNDLNEYPAIPLGTWRLPLVTTGEKDYLVELEIPPTLQPGAWEIAAHEYPTGEFFPAEGTSPLVLVVEAAPELPVLDVTAIEVAQAALLVDPDSTVVDPTLYRDAPFAANLELVAQNYGAASVPVTAHLALTGGELVPLRIWDPAQAQWVETLVVDALEADVPRGVYLELAVAEALADPIRAQLGAEPLALQIVVTVNADRSGEADCVVDHPEAPVNCRHAAVADALVAMAPPAAPEEAGPMMMTALAATANTAPLRYEKAWSKTIGNDWARAGVAFSGFAQLSSAGYEASARGNVPMRLLGLPEFQFVDATASADALVDGSTSVGVLVKAIGLNVYDRRYEGNPAQWELGKEFPFVQKEKSFTKTVIVYVVPVTFKLGASGELGLRGDLIATFVPGPSDVASLTLSGGPYANADGFGEGAVGVAFLSAGARVTLTLVNAGLTAEATGSLTLSKRPDGRPLEIAGGLSERLSYATSFLDGRVGLVVTYPTIKWCKVWFMRLPCGFRTVTKEAVLASWPGYSYGGDILNLSQDLFSIDVCTPDGTCDGRCGTIDDGCRTQDCGGCQPGWSCGAGNVCVCTPAATCDGRCGTIDDGCGGPRECGGCPAGQTCRASACVPATGFAFPGLYDVQHRWGGPAGTWYDQTGDGRALDIVVHADGRVFRGGAPIVNPTVGADTVSWSMAGNGTEGNVTFRDGSTNVDIWGPAGRTGVLFEGLGGAAAHGIRFPNEGWLDFRGVRTCVPAITCEGRCGLTFDGCALVECGGCPAGQWCQSGAVGGNVCTDGTAPYMTGTYTTGHKWGGWSGTWSQGSDLRITAAGEIFLGASRIVNSTMVGGKTPGLYHSWTVGCATCHGPDYPRPALSWTMADGNDSEAAVTFAEGSANEYFWPDGQTGWLYEGWIQYRGPDGALDFRGLKR